MKKDIGRSVDFDAFVLETRYHIVGGTRKQPTRQAASGMSQLYDQRNQMATESTPWSLLFSLSPFSLYRDIKQDDVEDLNDD